MSTLKSVMQRLSNDDQPHSLSYYPLSVKLGTEHQAIVQSLVESGVVQNKTEAIRLLIEAGYNYLIEKLPDYVGSAVEEKNEEYLQELRYLEMHSELEAD